MSTSLVTRYEIEIRPVRVADIERWLNLRVALWPAQALDIHREQIAGLTGPGNESCCFVAVNADGALAGFIELSIRSTADGCQTGPVAYVDGIFVIPAARRSGLAQRLLVVAEEWAAKHNLLELAADVALDNRAGQQLHLASGFDEVSRHVAYRKEVKFTEQRSVPATPSAAQALLAAEQPMSSMVESSAAVDYGHLLSAQGQSTRGLGLSFFVINAVLALITVVCLAMSSIYSNDIWRGGVLPMLSGVLILYFVLVALWLNARRRR